MLMRYAVVLALAGGAAYAGEWEVGALGGYAYSPKQTVNSPAGSADARFKDGGVVGVFGGNDTYKYWSGEVRYLYRFSDAELSNGSTTATFGAHTHIIHADFLAHFRPLESKYRPYIAFGGGAKVIQGTGIESAAQPLGRFAALTATQELLPVADIGAGFKIDLKTHLRFRFEVRDYLSPAPSRVIAPVPGGSISGVWNDIIGLGGISYTF